MIDRWFALLAIAVVAMSSVSATAAVGADDPSAEPWAPDVPDVDAAPATAEAGVATVAGTEYRSLQAAIDAAEPGETVVVTGSFEERPVVETPDIHIVADGDAVVDGGGTDVVLAVEAANVTVEGIGVRGSGHDRTQEDAAIFVNASNATIRHVAIGDSLYGIWVNGVSNATITENTIVGRDGIALNERGNGIHLWQAEGAHVVANDVTQVRDGIYFQWSSDVQAEENRLWDLRYGVHYMYSDDNRLRGNLAWDNDVGFALMVSSNLTITENVAVRNDGPSGHGILVKDIDRSEIRGNDLVANDPGLYVYNAQDNEITDNLVLENGQGIHLTAGTQGEVVAGNSFINNDIAAYTTGNTQTDWNASSHGNYWSDARVLDFDDDGVSEIRHRPTGAVERLVHERPQAAAFTASPAFDAVRLAESSFPVLEDSGMVDHRPLAEPAHDHWRDYYDD